jgi:hypothetical protein
VIRSSFSGIRRHSDSWVCYSSAAYPHSTSTCMQDSTVLTQGTMILLVIRKSKSDSGFWTVGVVAFYGSRHRRDIPDGTISENVSHRSPRYDGQGLMPCFFARRICRTIEAAASFLACCERSVQKGQMMSYGGLLNVASKGPNSFLLTAYMPGALIWFSVFAHCPPMARSYGHGIGQPSRQ